jgi:hypothetical protein
MLRIQLNQPKPTLEQRLAQEALELSRNLGDDGVR